MEEVYRNLWTALMRYGAPGLAAVLLLRCLWPLLWHRQTAFVWAWLECANGQRLAVRHWENCIGRGRRSDVRVDFPTVSRSHAVLTRYDDGSWTVTEAASAGITVNGEFVTIQALQDGDVIGLGGVELTFHTQQMQADKPPAAGRWRAAADVCLLTVLQFCLCVAGLLADRTQAMSLILGFGGLAALQWVLLTAYFLMDRPAFEVETLAFFLSTMGMAVIAVVSAAELGKQLLAVVLGVAAFQVTGWSMRSLERAKGFRYLAAVAGMALLAVTLLFGETYYGAKNWLMLGGVSLQPSELAKVCFVYVGASPMERLMKKRNLVLLIAYTVALCGLLALMNDFGTALVFFSAFLLIAYLRSGSIGTVALALTALLFAGVIGLHLAPHALRRLQTWRHIWEDPLGAGYQQTRALMSIASGGLFGLGMGNGKMRQIFAADSDMVFATVAEEWGLVMAVLCVLCIVVPALFSVKCARYSRSSFYAIGSCTAAGILLVQTMLNVLGTVDVLPLTGVTFPLLSNGGSSMVGVWALLAFIKAADNRPGGSFAVKRSRNG